MTTVPASKPVVSPLRLLAAVGALLLVGIAIFIALFQWNWLRGPLARYLTARLERPVTITGDLDVHPWSWKPRATVTGVTIGNPPWAGPAPMAVLPRFSAQIALKPLILQGRTIFPFMQADRPSVALFRNAKGRENWRSVSGVGRPLKLPAIEHLVIHDGRVRYVDIPRRVRFLGTANSRDTLVGPDRGDFRLDGAGSLKGTPFSLSVHGGPLIHLDPKLPYHFNGRLTSGPTHILADGIFKRPFDFSHITGVVHASGPDFGQLYALTGVALPTTPPYDLAAGFAREDQSYAFRHLHGRVGDSDLAGAITVERRDGRPNVTANLASRRLKLADLMTVIGGAPRHTAGHTVSMAEKRTAARLAAEHRLLPDTPLDISRIRGTDARLTYAARSVDAGKLPTRNLMLKASLDHGLLVVDPFAVRLPQGDLAGSIRLNARGRTPVTALDLRLANARLETLVEHGGANPPVVGGLYARTALKGAGNSVRAAAAHANGQVTVVIPGGQMRQAFAELMGINVARGLILILEKNHGATPIRCAVADFKATDGVLRAQAIVLDTGVVIATGSGDVNLRDETLNLAFAGKPKKFRLIRVGAPITIKGSLEKPKLGVDVAKAAPQAAASVLLGALVSPLAAILPFIGPGLAKDANCASLTAQAEARGAPLRRR